LPIRRNRCATNDGEYLRSKKLPFRWFDILGNVRQSLAMKLYTCDQCGNLLYFENTLCLKCNHAVGFDPGRLDLLTLKSLDNERFLHSIDSSSSVFKFCRNHEYGVCNWLVPVDSTLEFCTACALNRTIPWLSELNHSRWKKIEVAKHRLVYSLIRLKLPVTPKRIGGEGIAFDFLANTPSTRVVTGHLNGVITLNIEEADEDQLTRSKLDLGERYRTLLGHFRHEIGHYYWDVLIKSSSKHDAFRNTFGDESLSYHDALKNYYHNGPSTQWFDSFISPYATAHPWEDWAETWAHYLHLMDTLETAFYFGIRVDPKKQTGVRSLDAEVSRDPYSMENFQDIFQMWLPLTFAVNSLNRAMGHADFYPFVITSSVFEKLKFIHEICRHQRSVPQEELQLAIK
jgi:hypothetical protein